MFLFFNLRSSSDLHFIKVRYELFVKLRYFYD